MERLLRAVEDQYLACNIKSNRVTSYFLHWNAPNTSNSRPAKSSKIFNELKIVAVVNYNSYNHSQKWF